MKNILFVTILVFIYLNTNAQLKVSCTGTSITAGYGITDSLSYPSQLQKILSKDAVGNFGVSASTMLHQTSHAYIQSANYTSAQNYNPNIVTIEFGTNDSQPQYWNNYKDSFVSDYTNFINVFKALETHPSIYACLPIPALSSLYGISDSTITYVIIPLIQSIAKNNRIHLIDLNTPFKNHPEYYQADGIHPNATGAQVLAQVMSKAIATPIDLTASVIGLHKIKLSWLINNNEKSFAIQRSTDSATWKTIYKPAANVKQYTDTTLADSIKYFYRIQAVILTGNTWYTQAVSAVTNYNNTLIPSITSADSAGGTQGIAFTYTITATNNPTSYAASGLPQGLSVNKTTGKITGNPTLTRGSGGATFIVLLSAANAHGTVKKALKLSISQASMIAVNDYKLLEKL